MTRGWTDGGTEEQCSRGAGPGPAPRTGQCKNNNCKTANCCTFLPRGAAVHVDGANGEWHSVCVWFVCLECVRPCLYISLYVCDNVLFKCNNFNCNLPCVTPRHLTPSSPPEGSAVSACLLRRVLCVCDDQLTASLHLFMSD